MSNVISTLAQPADEADVVAAVAEARSAGTPVDVVGGGSKRGLGRPVQAATTLSTTALTGIKFFEPKEMVLSAAAGTPLAEIEDALRTAGQRMAFEVPDWRTLLGSEQAVPTIGGAVSVNAAGPRRINQGAARDHVLGVRAVTGRAEAIQSGGRVMKNVTGYDLCKLFTGAYGTLGVLTDVTVKVLPVSETEATLILTGLDDETARKALSAGLASPFDVTGAAHLPAGQAATSAVEPVRSAGGGVTAIRIEGFEASVRYRADELIDLLAEHGNAAVLGADDSRSLWTEIRDVLPLAGEPDRPVWRLSVKPTAGPSTVALIRQKLDADAVYDWGGGLVWLRPTPTNDGGTSIIRSAVAVAGGHAMLFRGSETLRAAVDVFPPQDSVRAALTQRLAAAFDPDRILSPGRMYA